jgi:hypothetical protein
MKKEVSAFVGGAVATAAIPLSNGMTNWKVLAGAAALGGVGALCGVNVPQMLKKYAAKRAAVKPE